MIHARLRFAQFKDTKSSSKACVCYLFIDEWFYGIFIETVFNEVHICEVAVEYLWVMKKSELSI